MPSSTVLQQLIGGWSGTDQLWFEPDQLANESEVTALVRPTLDGSGVIEEYRWSFGDEVHHGTMLIVATATGHEIALVDTFHTGGTVMHLVAPSDPDPDAVVDALGSYDAEGARWGWRVVVHQIDLDRLEISAWNISPQGDAARAVLTQLRRDA